MKVGQNADKKDVLETLLDLGMVLVAIDARDEGVDVPTHLGVDPQLRLNLSYRFGRPMTVDAWGILAELTFGGEPYPCKFPWQAIFLIVSHVNGESYLFPDHVPRELLQQAAHESAPAAPERKPSRPKLALVQEPGATKADETPTTPDAPLPSPSSQKPTGGEEQGTSHAHSKIQSASQPPDPSPTKPPKNRSHLRLVK